MKVLVACEESQVVTLAFRQKGYEAFSCDILPCSGGRPEWHLQQDALEVAYNGTWDLMIAHPPCTYLTNTGARWLYDRRYPDRLRQRQEALEFFLALYNAPIEKVCLENPVGYVSSAFRKPDQYVHPYFFGDPVSKKTGLWLRNLPKLESTNIVEPQKYTSSSGRVWDKWYFETSMINNLAERSRVRSKTFPGIARAMADQWG